MTSQPSDSSEKGLSSTAESSATNKSLECPICFSPLKDSFVTPCQHTFCYECITKHLETKNTCPSCGKYLVLSLLKPNYEVDEAVRIYEEKKLKKRKRSNYISSDVTESLQRMLSQVDHLSTEELNCLIEDLKSKKEHLEQTEKHEDELLLLEFLQQAISKKESDIQRLQKQLQVLLQSRNHLGSRSSFLKNNAISLLKNHIQTSSLHMNRRQKVLECFNYLEERLYALQPCVVDEPNTNEETIIDTALNTFQEDLFNISRYASLHCKATLKHTEIPNISNIISSIEFDRDSEYIATAGVTKRIRIFEFGNIMESVIDTHYPVKEMVSPTKLSCLCWNSYIRNHLISSDYEGVVTLWDTVTGRTINEYEEHEKRIWSVDFSHVEPTRFASASDDGKVKIWTTIDLNSIATIDNKANVCCVQFHPSVGHLVSFGSADHHVYLYDLRQTKQPLQVLKGHQKAVAYIKYMNNNQLVSASTDGTLKLWDLSQSTAQRTFQGHQNEKNFVGLSVTKNYIACGSENNTVYIYYRAIPIPILSYRMNAENPLTGEETVDNSHFVSSVCWCPNKPQLLVAANSQGIIKVLEMIEDS